MDPHPRNFPVLSYVMSRLPSFGARAPPSPSSAQSHIDIEQPKPSSSASAFADHHSEIEGKMPQLLDPAILASMTRAIAEVSQARSVLKLIGDRPTHEEIDNAKAKLVDIEAHLSRQLEEIVSLPRPPETPPDMWREHIAQREKKCKDDAEKERRVFKSLVQIDDMHDEYEKLLKDAEKRLVKIYEQGGQEEDEAGDGGEEVSEKVKGILEDAKVKGVERVDLSNQRLRLLPEAFGRLHALVVLHASGNQLTVTTISHFLHFLVIIWHSIILIIIFIGR